MLKELGAPVMRSDGLMARGTRVNTLENNVTTTFIYSPLKEQHNEVIMQPRACNPPLAHRRQAIRNAVMTQGAVAQIGTERTSFRIPEAILNCISHNLILGSMTFWDWAPTITFTSFGKLHFSEPHFR